MKNINKKLNKKNLTIIFIVLTMVLIGKINFVFAATGWENVGNTILGGAGAAVALIVGFLAYIVTFVVGLFITLFVTILIDVAQYSNIIDVPTVIQGWIIIRDLCNMFFILILLVIAFSTILRYEEYSAKKLLPKILIMAVMINFSRTIFGLMIDFSQIVMLTFVNAFSSGGGWFIEMFRVNLYLKIMSGDPYKSTGDFSVTTWSTAAAIIAAVFASLITLIVLVAFVAVLIMRVIMLWIYTIFSPLVFLGFAFPPIAKYTSKIWEDFTKQLVVGPVLAFFLWLALTTAQDSAGLLKGQDVTGVCAGIGALFCTGEFQKYLIVVGLLMGGLMVTQQMGGAISKAASFGENWSKKGLKGAAGITMWGGAWAARKIKMGAASDLLAERDDKVAVWDKKNNRWMKDAEGNQVYKTQFKVPLKDKEGKLMKDDKGNQIYGGKIRAGLANALYGLELNPKKIFKGISEGLDSKTKEDEMQGTVASSAMLKAGGFGGLIKGLGVSRDLTEALANGFFWNKGFARVIKIIQGTTEKRASLQRDIDLQKKLFQGMTTTEENHAQVAKIQSTRDKISKLDPVADEAEVIRLKKIESEQLDELKELNAKMTVSKKEKDAEGVKLAKMQKDATAYRPVQTFYADREREALISDARKKIGDNDNEEILIEMFNNAIDSDDKEAAAAIMIHAAKVGHLNEIIHSQIAEDDVLDELGNVFIKKGSQMTQSGLGLNALVSQVLIKKLGMDDQQAYAIQSSASSLAKSVGHANLSETVGSKNGFLYQRNREEQLGRARSEARKVDVEKRARDRNRMSIGDEIQNPDGSRTFVTNELGFDEFLEGPGMWMAEVKKKRFNENKALNIYSDHVRWMEFVRELENLAKAEGSNIDKFYDTDKDNGKDKPKGGYIPYRTVAEAVINYGESIAASSKGKGHKQVQTIVKNLPPRT